MTTPTSDDLIEHAMRLVADELVLGPLADPTAPPRARARAVGRVVGSSGVAALSPGSPLAAWLDGSALDPRWRRRVPVRPGSLWGEYHALLARYGEPEGADLLSRYRALVDREQAA